MAKQLTLDELIEAADRARLPTAKPIMRAIESLAMALGADLAERLGVLCGEARFDSLDGLMIAFHARTKWQPCPEALCEFDPDEWDEGPQPPATEPGEQASPERPETMAMFVARYENRHGECRHPRLSDDHARSSLEERDRPRQLGCGPRRPAAGRGRRRMVRPAG